MGTEPLQDKSPHTRQECANSSLLYIYKRLSLQTIDHQPNCPSNKLHARSVSRELTLLPTFLAAVGRPAGNTSAVSIPFLRLLLSPLELQRHRRIFKFVPGRHGDNG